MVEKIGVSPLRGLYESYQNKIASEDSPTVSFSSLLKNAIENLNNSQLQADQTINGFLKGEVTDVHKVMIVLEKANLDLRMAMQIRNKVVEAYQEIMRMQV